MTTIIATIKRPNGNLEEVNLYPRWILMNKIIFNKIKSATLEAGKGEVLQIAYTHEVSNEWELAEKYRRDFLEGGEGYIPDMSSKATITTRTEIFK